MNLKDDIFWLDSDCGSYSTYKEIIQQCNKAVDYSPYFQSDNLVDFWVNSITAIIHHLPITILDTDFSKEELIANGIELESLNKKIPVSQISLVKVSQFTPDLFLQSECRISLFTSGTTGKPKIVTHTVANLCRGLKTGHNHQQDIWGFCYNPTHIAGLQVFLQAVVNQNPMIFLFKKDPPNIIESIQQFGITHLSATATFYRLLLSIDTSCNSVKRISIGGERSDENLYKAINTIFPAAKITNIYASTEAGSLLASNDGIFKIPSEHAAKFKIENNELLIHSSLMGSSDLIDIKDEWYHTGDIVELMQANSQSFKIVARVNDFINVGGNKVNPADVELALLQHIAVKLARVYGKGNPITGHIICAEVQLNIGYLLSEKELIDFLSDKLQDYKIPRIIKMVETFSETRSGKLKR